MRKASAIACLAAALALGGCGYRPLYGSSADSAGVSATMASVSIPAADNRIGQIIRNDLISSMRSGASEDRFTLQIVPSVKKNSIIQKPTVDNQRQAVNLSVEFDLIDKATGKSLHKGKTFSQASYDVVGQPFADQQAETNATERAAHEVSADIRIRIAAYFSSNPPTP
jgi:LPS-assembly lipoprotein